MGGGKSDRRCAGGIVDGFDQGEAAAAFSTVADWLRIVGDGVEEIFEDGLVATDVGYGGGGCALICVAVGDAGKVRGRIAQVGDDDAVVLEDYGAFGASDVEAARVAGIGGSGGEERAEGAAGKFERGDGGIFGFDFVQHGGGAGLHASYIAEEPEQEVDGVDGLVDERTATVEGESAAPLGAGVVVGRAIPLDARIDEERLAEEAGVEPVLQALDVGLEAILEDYGELYVGFVGGGDEGVCFFCRNVDGLFGEDVEAMVGGGNALLGVKAGGSTEDDEVERLVREEGGEVGVRLGMVFGGEAGNGLRICAVDGGDLDGGDGTSGAGVGLGDVAGADESDVRGHGKRNDAFRMLMIRDFLGGKRREGFVQSSRRRSTEGTEKPRLKQSGY